MERWWEFFLYLFCFFKSALTSMYPPSYFWTMQPLCYHAVPVAANTLGFESFIGRYTIWLPFELLKIHRHQTFLLCCRSVAQFTWYPQRERVRVREIEPMWSAPHITMNETGFLLFWCISRSRLLTEFCQLFCSPVLSASLAEQSSSGVCWTWSDGLETS